MTNTGLYQLKRKDIKPLSAFLTESFYDDPLYLELLPDENIRKKLLPLFFECYLKTAFKHCEIYADSPAMNGIISIFDDSNQSSHFSYIMKVILYSTDFALKTIFIDKSMKTLYHFIKNVQFLTSTWENDIEYTKRDKVHIDFFAVKPAYQGKGIGKRMISEVLNYADKKHCLTTLETHNSKNVYMYQHYGFQLFKTFSNEFKPLKEYCMIRS